MKADLHAPAVPDQPPRSSAPAVRAATADAGTSPRLVAQRSRIQALFGQLVQANPMSPEAPLQARASPAASGGLPGGLRAGIEALSGMDMAGVRVHHDSDRPAQLHALAYAQGNDIHLAPGQEQHLPHEAWHVVQQAQGRVPQTLQLASGTAINDDAGLEREADTMGARALQGPGAGGARSSVAQRAAPSVDATDVVQRVLSDHWHVMAHNAHHNPKFALTVGHIPQEVCDQLLEYFDIVNTSTYSDAYAAELLRKQLARLREAVTQWLSDRTEAGEQDGTRLPLVRIQELLAEIRAEENALPSTSLEDGFPSVAAAFAALGVAPTVYVPANEVAEQQQVQGGAQPAKSVNAVSRLAYNESAGSFVGYFKAEKSALAENEMGAVKFGVPKALPRLSARSVTSYLIARQLGVPEIPETHYAVHRIDGRYFPGTVMKAAPRRGDVWEVQKESKKEPQPGQEPGHQELMAKLPTYRKLLSRLQLFDQIAGQTDRHHGNILLSPDGSVHGIDNDLSFGDQNLVGDTHAFSKVNTLPLERIVAADDYMRQIIEIAGNAAAVRACEQIVATHLGVAEALAFTARLKKLAELLGQRKGVPTEAWHATKAMFSLGSATGGFPVAF